MKSKIVLWGQNEKDEKILVALELKARENKVYIYTFSEEQATEVFYNRMMDEWRDDKELDFPEGHQKIEQSLSVTGDLLPEHIKVQRTDLIARAKAEWHFVVLSAKMHELYKTELDELKSRVQSLRTYDNALWEEMKTFWSKVQGQIYEKNLFREHADQLKEETNYLFDRLKELRTKANAELEGVSKQRFEKFEARLSEIGDKIEKGLGLNPIFEELKNIQKDFKEETFTRQHRSRLWKKIDEAFKIVKEKKYGKKAAESSGSSRLERRYQGLMAAIEKMERSINRDKKDVEYQKRKAGETDGQLEQQIRQAKIKMIEERIHSKSEKLDEMHATRADLEARMEKEKSKEARRKEQEEIARAKEEVKEKIASEIKEKSESLSEEAQKLKDAAEAINEKPKDKKERKESMLEAISSTMGEALEDVVDTTKAVGEVVAENIGNKVEEIKKDPEISARLKGVKDSVKKMAEDVSRKVDKLMKEEELAADLKEEEE